MEFIRWTDFLYIAYEKQRHLIWYLGVDDLNFKRSSTIVHIEFKLVVNKIWIVFLFLYSLRIISFNFFFFRDRGPTLLVLPSPPLEPWPWSPMQVETKVNKYMVNGTVKNYRYTIIRHNISTVSGGIFFHNRYKYMMLTKRVLTRTTQERGEVGFSKGIGSGNGPN